VQSRQGYWDVRYWIKAQGECIVVKYCLREVLKEKHVSQGKLSRLADVSPSTIRRLCTEGTTYNVSIEVLEKIAKALGVKISDLIEE
jgi:transcriptional regulator with XRE-family HTH domain